MGDTSANGTWLNGQRLRAGWFAELRPRDRVSFLPASHALYPDALQYEVTELRLSAILTPEQVIEQTRAPGENEKGTKTQSVKRRHASEAHVSGLSTKRQRPDESADAS